MATYYLMIYTTSVMMATYYFIIYTTYVLPGGDVLFYNLHNFFDDGDALLDNLLYFSCAWWTINSTCWFRRFVSHVFSGNN